MTVVVACRFLTSVMIFADCRVSYGEAISEVDDNLRKIYQIDERMVLSFAGPLEGAYQVIETVRKNVKNYSRPPVAVNLLNDVQRWIRYEYQSLPQKLRQDLSFILAAVEPTRMATSEGPEWIPSKPELWIVKLPPFKNKDELVKPGGDRAVIGIDEEPEKRAEIIESIQSSLNRWFGFSFKQPDLQAVVIANVLMTKLMESDIKGVGGLFQGAILDAKGIHWLDYGSREVALNIVNGEYVQRDNATGREVRLRTIWDWWQEWEHKHCRRQPGASVIFEDPGLREAVDKQQQIGGSLLGAG